MACAEVCYMMANSICETGTSAICEHLYRCKVTVLENFDRTKTKPFISKIYSYHIFHILPPSSSGAKPFRPI